MFPRAYFYGEGGIPWDVHQLVSLSNSQQKPPTKDKRRGQRSSSGDNFPPLHVGYEENSHVVEISGSFGSGDQLAELQRKNEELELKETELRARLEEKDNQLQERETELNELKKTLSMYDELKKTLCMYDDCSETDLRRMVDSINTRIADVACTTAIHWLRDVSKTSENTRHSGKVSEAEMGDIERLIGIQVVNLLSDGGEVAAMLLPLAWQASIIATVAKILSSFSAPLAISREWQAGDVLLRKIADDVMMGEVQPAYGRWRLITHQYLRRILSTQERTAVQAYVRETLAHCRVVGQLVMKSHCPNEKTFEDAFQAQLHSIMEEALGLSTILQERRITANYEPFVPPTGAPFQPESMVVETRDKIFANDHVVCTTGLGLLYWKKEGRERTSERSPKHVFKEAQVFTERNLNNAFADP
ncbi:hypothetical protein FRC01_009499, partial [Tulasnella sp. 417]